jgi:nudix-type nucleoside diphosphatase (YffH/AdpP family)
MRQDDKKHAAPRDLDEEVLAREKYSFSRLTYELRRADGRWEKHERNLFRRPDAAVLLPYDSKRGKVLLTRQFRLGAYMNDSTLNLLEACAGTIDAGEPPDACMRREAMEEIGLHVADMRFLFEAFVSPAATRPLGRKCASATAAAWRRKARRSRSSKPLSMRRSARQRPARSATARR